MWEALVVVAQFSPDSLPFFKLLSALLSYKVTELMKEGRDIFNNRDLWAMSTVARLIKCIPEVYIVHY